MSYLTDVGLFALLFFLLVFFHELGHFLMAKWVGIKVEKFSIGMGPALLSCKFGETTYRIAALPLGGYVKMAGDDPSKEYSEEEARRGFLTQKPPAKLLVVFGGPVFNLILPIFIYAMMLSIGIPSAKTVVGLVVEDSPAEKAGLVSGDVIKTVDGKPMEKWKSFESLVRDSAGKTLQLGVERLNLSTTKIEDLEISITPELADGKSRFGEDIKVGRVGLSPAFPLPMIYYEDLQSALAQAGLKNFDQIESINGKQIYSLQQWRDFLSRKNLSSFDVTYSRDGGGEKSATIDVPAGEGSIGERIGMLPVELVIGNVVEGGRAAEAGLLAGDRLISIGGTKLDSWEEMSEIIKGSKGKPLEYVWSRNGQILSKVIEAEKTTIEDPLMGKDNPLAVQEKYRVGIGPRLEASTAFVVEQSYNPIKWLSRGVSEAWNLSEMTVTALYKLFTGQISIKLLGSPIMIYKVAGNTYRMAGGGHHGWIAFMTNLALLSVTLGLVNLLPVPVLDGGHAVFFAIEWIRGRPLSLKVMEVATQVGLFILIGLFALVIYNDFHRYGFLDPVFRLFQ